MVKKNESSSDLSAKASSSSSSSHSSSTNNKASTTLAKRAGAALFYGLASISIMMINKVVLTVYGFPSFSFLAASQFFMTTMILSTLNTLGMVGR